MARAKAKVKDTRSLIERMTNPSNTGKKGISGYLMADSPYAKDPLLAKTPIHILNIALSGSLDGGLYKGINMVVGDTQTFKSAYGAIIMGAYLRANPKAMLMFVDSEFGTTLDYFRNFGVDVDRVIHVVVTDINEMIYEVTTRLNLLSDDEQMGMMIDSIGLLGSRKEVDDAIANPDMPSDMTRAKVLNSFWRIITPKINKLKIPVYAINHYYEASGGFGDPRVIGGGKRGQLAANDIWMITNSQDKEGTEMVGQFFTITNFKSRKVKKYNKFKIQVRFDDSISSYTGLWDIAEELGFIHFPTARTAQPALLDASTGEIVPYDKYKPKQFTKAKPIETKEFWEPLLTHEPFKEAIEKKYMYSVDESLVNYDGFYDDDDDDDDFYTEEELLTKVIKS